MNGFGTIVFKCPCCKKSIAALPGRPLVNCDSCGHIAQVPRVNDQDTGVFKSADLKQSRPA